MVTLEARVDKLVAPEQSLGHEVSKGETSSRPRIVSLASAALLCIVIVAHFFKFNRYNQVSLLPDSLRKKKSPGTHFERLTNTDAMAMEPISTYAAPGLITLLDQALYRANEGSFTGRCQQPMSH